MLALGYSSFVAIALPALGYDALCTYALLGEAERALDVLEQWIRLAGADEILWFKNDPDFDSIKESPRYQKLLKPAEETA